MRSVAKYGGIAFQFGVFSGLGFYGGHELDKYVDNEKPIYAAIFAILGLAIAFYVVFKDLIKKD